MRTHKASVEHRVKVTDPPLTRRGGMLTHPGSLVLAAIAVIYTLYLFGVIPQSFFDRLFGGLAGRADLVSGNRGEAIELIIGLAALVLVYTLIMPFVHYARQKRQLKRKRVAARK